MNTRLRECELVYRRTSRKGVPRATVRSSECVYRLFEPETRRAHESVWAVLLNARGEIVATHEVARGSVSSVSIEPASILRAAVVAAAPSLIIVHNHPSGNPSPSAEDIAFTHKVVRAARVLGIQVLDHIVIAEDGYASLLDRGLLRTAHDVP